MSIASVFKKFPRTFWVANTIELFERWAWYGFFMLFANYLTGSSDAGGLEFTQAQKGIIMGVGTGILYFLPVITGSIADKYGYRKVLYIAFTVYISAFILLPMADTFTGVFAMYLYLALGAALFKPIISATIAKTTTDETSSIGFGIFYMMVNIGAFFGPMITLLYKNSSYNLVFYISAGIIALNFILLLFYKEPNRQVNEDSLTTSLSKVFKNIGLVLKDFKFMLFLLIVAGFWTMYNQLFFTLPVFIAQWVDTSVVYSFFHTYIPFISENYSAHNGQMEAEFITNFDALFIIIFQIIVSTIVMKWKPLRTMMSGFLVCAIGMSLTLFSQNVLFTFAAIYIFAIGEMAGSPKITEYIGRIAPSDKKALYMGYSFIPVFLGNVFAGIISGNVYQSMSDKTEFVKHEVMKRGLEISEGLSQNEYFNQAAKAMNMNPRELTNYLWSSYHPSRIWYIILAIGLFAVVALFFYDKLLMNKKA
ncbi:MFS transporter [Ancylomarina longa]|uniref:MFS transporter n=1 Tax=Ancylomarina longa TaxID=2487017 RepID=A0A434AV75_9BACT|nr:MFS transporter [Ancylomarina longa]RUT78377.1 MFS transporter [Ancylomarina longa]